MSGSKKVSSPSIINSIMKKFLRTTGYGSLAVVILMMMAATFIEKFKGTEAALKIIYHNPVFMVLWGIAAICFLLYFLSEGGAKRFFTLLLYIAFPVILLGALITHLRGQDGEVRLDPGVTESQWVMEDGSVRELPVPMTLEKFEIERYPGSQMPSDYRSTITVGTGQDTQTLVISMNKIGKIEGYRFYQSDFDGDSSILMVVRDPWGVGVTYAGYLLLLIGMLGFFFQKDTGFKRAVARLSEAGETGRRISPKLILILRIAAGALLAYTTFVLGRSWVISGHVPFVGGYAVMMVMAWMSALAMVVLGKRFPVIFVPGFLLAFFTMLLAFRSGAASANTPLAPVLRSPLLSVHVLSMMMSYTFLGLVALLGVTGLLKSGEEAGRNLMDLSLAILYPAVFLIAFGTFLGAVWANISWGSYWAWDPKETWALITLLVYAAALHGASVKVFRNPKLFHIYVFIAFICVLITYFGVNLVLGGMHSYS